MISSLSGLTRKRGMARASLAIPTRFLVAPDKLDIKRHKHGILYLADSFSKNSSSENYTSKFRNIKNQQEKQKLKFTSDNTENYHSEFLLSGPDDIQGHYQLLKHLPISTLLILLEIFNNIWKTGNIPKSWKEATVIPIPKPDKDHTDPTNYRPIDELYMQNNGANDQ